MERTLLEALSKGAMLDNELKERGTAQDPSEAGRESNKLLCQEKGSPSGLSRDKVDGGVSQDHSAKDEALETGQDAPSSGDICNSMQRLLQVEDYTNEGKV